MSKAEDNGEATSYENLGNVFHLSVNKEYLQKALQIQREIGDKNGEATSYGNLGNVFTSLEYVKAEYVRKAQIQREISSESLGNISQNMSRLKNIFRKRQQQQPVISRKRNWLKTSTSERQIGHKKKQPVTHTWEMCFNLSVNMSRL